MEQLHLLSLIDEIWARMFPEICGAEREKLGAGVIKLILGRSACPIADIMDSLNYRKGEIGRTDSFETARWQPRSSRELCRGDE